MFLHIDTSADLPIYDQIVRQVKFAVARGAIVPGNLVPSVREMARELAINPNTVARAYQQLQTDGVLQSVRGMGLEVATGAAALCRRERQRLIQARVRQTLIEARHSGMDMNQLRKLIDRELESADGETRES